VLGIQFGSVGEIHITIPLGLRQRLTLRRDPVGRRGWWAFRWKKGALEPVEPFAEPPIAGPGPWVFHDDGPAGVREPRRPRPSSHGSAVALPPDD